MTDFLIRLRALISAMESNGVSVDTRPRISIELPRDDALRLCFRIENEMKRMQLDTRLSWRFNIGDEVEILGFAVKVTEKGK